MKNTLLAVVGTMVIAVSGAWAQAKPADKPAQSQAQSQGEAKHCPNCKCGHCQKCEKCDRKGHMHGRHQHGQTK